ncbi:MAG TPA: glycosyltransferase [Polyangiaceae bacterium]
MRIYLVEPDAQGRISGGYLYNQRLAAAGAAISVVSTTLGSLAASLGALELESADWLLLDSLFLEPAAFAAFADVRRTTGCRLGLVLHAFPSFVERADRGDKDGLIDPRPTGSELALVAQLDAVVCPGPYAPRLLRQSGLETPTLVCSPGQMSFGTMPAARSTVLPLRVLTVGNVTRGKGYQDALDALAGCADLEWRWQILGSLAWDPELVAALGRHALAAGIRERIEFLGQRSPQATARYYVESDVFLLASLTENHPLVLLEARAYGLPVVGYRVGGVPDIVAGGGLLASPFDQGELSALLRQVLSDAAERTRLRSIALGAAAEATNWSESATGLCQRLRALGART